MAPTIRSAREIFLAAVDRSDPADREKYLHQACGEDAGLRQHVAALLRVHDEPDSLLDQERIEAQVALHEAANPTLDQSTEAAGAVIGPYKLLEQIGAGGMGSVWMAQQVEPVKRLVAVKLVKPGMDPRQEIARFEAERQALALMDHPNIAKVLDAGTTAAGRPYFVMDLVKGVPITKYCDEHRLTPRQRLELFVSVCQAVQHAHHKGIIHRDLKPSNVLVALYDGQPVPKVIDFGIAKAAGQALTDKTLVTGFGAIVGTLEYMSPEQAEFNQLDIDTRSDIYSLGVLLYELLTGSPPFTRQELEKPGMLELLRVIREEEPTRPSTKLSTAEGLPTLAANRGTEPARLPRLVRGELDWIVMKALEKDRSRRYETAIGFAADVQRYLADEPVQACPPSVGYRLRTFVRRNKRALATAALLGAMVLVAVLALAVSYVRTSQGLEQETRANQDRQTALESEKEAKESLERTAYIQRIALAGRELAAGNVGRAEQLLEECPEHLRGWEWHFLKRKRYGPIPPLRHSATVVKVQLSPDGRQIASACMDGSLTIWDAQAPRQSPPLVLQTRMPQIRTMVYSRDSEYLAAADGNGTVSVWRTADGELVASFRGHQKIVRQIAFSPDGRTLASASQDGKVRLWDIRGQQGNGGDRLIREFAVHATDANAVAFTPDGGRLLAAFRDGTVKTWDATDGRPLSAFRRPIANAESARFSSNTRQLAWSCWDGILKVWDTATEEEYTVHTDLHIGRSVAFDPDGRLIAVAGFDGTVRLLDSSTGDERLTIHAHPSLVADVAFSPDGHRLASASYDYTVRLWDATPLNSDPLAGRCVTLAGHDGLVSGVAFSRDGRWLASGSLDGTMKVWEVDGSRHADRDSYSLRYTVRGHGGHVIGVAFSPNNQTIATAGRDAVKLWDFRELDGDAIAELRTIRPSHQVFSIEFSQDGGLLAIGQFYGIGLYDPATGKEAHPFKRTPNPVPSLAFHPDGAFLASAGASDPAVKVWALGADKPGIDIRHYSNPNSSVAVSSDGRLIASPGRDQAAGDHTVKVWEVNWKAGTYKEVHTLRGHVHYVWRVAFSPDGRYLASGSWDSTVKVWDLEAPDSAEPVTLHGHAGRIQGLAFSPDGKRLASASGYAGRGEVKVWDSTLWTARESGER